MHEQTLKKGVGLTSLILFSLLLVQMDEKPKYQDVFQFKSVRLLKDQSLGIGSYGAVCKAKCDDLLCAAKIIHPTLFDPTALHQIDSQKEHRLPIRRFEQECEFMSAIRHSNIVQYLGTFRDTDTHLPVLLMELMDDSLTHFLEHSTQPIPYHIQVNLCHDITLALSFLHSNNIIHRDLSSNNVLMMGNVRAKVTDFGMARLGDINPCFTNTMCPGTDVYMPPEAVQDRPVYTEKIDCFSFGVIIIQILTRQFPKPGDRLQEIELNHPGLPPGKILVQAPEVNRRQNHISQIPPNHSLLRIVLDCLKDEDSERPSAHQLCERVADLKGMPKYIGSARTQQDKDEVIRSQATRMEVNEHIISLKEEENRQLRQQLQQERDEVSRQLEEREGQLNREMRQLQQERDQSNKQLEENTKLNQQLRHLQKESDRVNRHLEEKNIKLNQQLRHLQQERDRSKRQLEERERQLTQQLKQIQQKSYQALREKLTQLQEREIQLGRVNQQLEASEQIVAQFERRIVELEQQLRQREKQETKASSRGKELTSIKLRWREGKRASCKIFRYFDAVVDGNTAYVNDRGTVKILSYNITSDSWSQLPDCINVNGSITVVNGWLTTVGGGTLLPRTYSNELFSLTVDGSDRIWTKKFSPMQTKRSNTTSLCTGTTLIVAGGWNKVGVQSTVEVMNTENYQWSTAAELPEPMYWASITICDDQIYMLGGADKNHTFIKSVYTCSVSALLQSCVPSSLEAKLERTSTVKKDRYKLSYFTLISHVYQMIKHVIG